MAPHGRCPVSLAKGLFADRLANDRNGSCPWPGPIAVVQQRTRRRVQGLFKRRDLLSSDVVEAMLQWSNAGGFSVDASVLIEASWALVGRGLATSAAPNGTRIVLRARNRTAVLVFMLGIDHKHRLWWHM